jgi:hypothetical protein
VLSGGPRALKQLKDLKLRPAKSDYGPMLKWESDIWEWFQRLAMPPAMGGPLMVNGADFMNVCQREGWDESIAFYLLDRVLGTYAKHMEEEKP